MAEGFQDPYEPGPLEAGSRKGTCIWCGKRGDSKEDVFSRWIDRQWDFQREGGGEREISLTRNFPSGAQKVTKVTKIATKLIASRGACEACNNGWMSQRDQAVIPLLGPMINGRAVSLDPSQQVEIATWASMKALCIDGDYRYEDAGMSSNAARAAVYERGEPPIHFGVRLAAYAVPGRFGLVRPYGRGTGGAGQALTGWVMTMVVGHLVLQVEGRTGSLESGILELAPGGLHSGDMFTCWPPQQGSCEWPPPIALGNAQLAEFGAIPMPDLADQPSYRQFVECFSDEPEHCDWCDDDHPRPERALPVPEGEIEYRCPLAKEV